MKIHTTLALLLILGAMAASQEPDISPDREFAAGVECLQQREWSDAVKRFSTVLADSPDRTNARIGLLLALFGQKELQLASDCVDQLSARNPERIDFLKMRGVFLFFSVPQSLGEAEELFARAARLNPTDAESWCYVAGCQYMAAMRSVPPGWRPVQDPSVREALRAAVATASKAISLAPKDHKALLLRGACHLALNQLHEAVQDLENAEAHAASAHDQEHCSALLAIAYGAAAEDCLRQGLGLRLSRDYIDAAFIREASEPEFHLMRATIHRHFSRDVEAVNDCTRAISLCPTQSEGYARRASAYLSLYRMSEARQDIDMAFANAGDPSFLLHSVRAEVAMAEADSQQAIDDLTKAIALDPAAAGSKLYFARSHAYAKQGKTTESADDYKTAIAKYEQGADTVRAAAYAWPSDPKLDATVFTVSCTDILNNWLATLGVTWRGRASKAIVIRLPEGQNAGGAGQENSGDQPK